MDLMIYGMFRVEAAINYSRLQANGKAGSQATDGFRNFGNQFEWLRQKVANGIDLSLESKERIREYSPTV